MAKYQDYVIKNGKFIGKFDEMYRSFPDPWLLLKKNSKKERLDYKIIYDFCLDVKTFNKNKKMKTLEIGCGFPQITDKLRKLGFNVYGTDISETVIMKSKKKYPHLKKKLFVSRFLNFDLYKKIDPEIIILNDITWYVLPELRKFINWFKRQKKRKYLVHGLCLYGKKKQKYGKNYFYDLPTIIKYFNLHFLSTALINNYNADQHSVFLASNKK